MEHLVYGREKAVYSPFSPFQCCSCVAENFKIHVDLQHRLGEWGERESGHTELAKFCSTLDCENF